MTTPNSNNDLVQAQYRYYRAVTRLANLWHALTVIGLVIYILIFVALIVFAVLSMGSISAIFSSFPLFNR
jgi:hypothetical protein